MLYIFVAFSAFINNASLYRAFGFTTQQPTIIGLILFLDILAPIDLVIKWVTNGISRRFEFEADAFAKQLGHSAELSRALIKLQIKNLSTMDADRWYARYNFSHPHLTERLDKLGWKPGEGDAPVVPSKEGAKTDTAVTTGRDEL